MLEPVCQNLDNCIIVVITVLPASGKFESLLFVLDTVVCEFATANPDSVEIFRHSYCIKDIRAIRPITPLTSDSE